MNKTLITLIISLSFSTLSSAQFQGATLHVKGEATLYAVPEQMMIHIPLETKNKSYESCTVSLMNKYNTLIEAFENQGFDKTTIKSTGLSINENFVWKNSQRQEDGFIGSLNLEIELPHTSELLGKIIHILKSDTFKHGYKLSFKLSEEQKQQLLAEVIDRAVKNAKTKGDLLANSMNIRLTKILKIDFDFSMPTYGPLMVQDEAVSFRSTNSKPSDFSLDPKKQSISKAVSVTWKIKQ